jgi:hypothetical protein
MISNKPLRRLLLLGGVALLIAIPAIGQETPESILPEGFGDPAPPPKQPKGEKPPKLPVELLPDEGGTVKPPPVSSAQSSHSALPSLSSGTETALASADDAANPEDAPIPVLVDLPPSVRRSTAVVGVLGPGDGDLGLAAFGQADGRYLTALTRNIRGPIASRWASILLRRALLSRSLTPAKVDGADWAAERAWLLLRMGEADSARLLVQSVDVDRYTPKMFQIGMQAALANGDAAGMCPMVEGAKAVSKEKAWPMAQAICSALGGESGNASAQIDSLHDRGAVKGVDLRLAEKVVGAGGNARRSVKIEWEDVPQLTAWRFGLASATAVPIPEPLMKTVGPQVRAWQVRLPLLSFTERQRAADVAATLGVYSSAALVDHYASIGDEPDVPEPTSDVVQSLEEAFDADTSDGRIAAMRSLWGAQGLDSRAAFARSIMTARAAALLPVSESYSSDTDNLVASMFTAGYDVQAARWTKLASGRALAMLAVGAPVPLSSFDSGDVSGFDGATENGRKLLFAGMAGLGRLDASSIESLASKLDVPIGRQSSWTRALDRAVAAKETGTVALLCAAALQTYDWSTVKPEYFFRAIAALRATGLEGEARMIAAEAVARS